VLFIFLQIYRIGVYLKKNPCKLFHDAKQLFDGIDSLTAEEKRLVSYLAYYKTYNDKAKEQFISASGYKKRLGKVFKKLKVNSTEAFLNYAVEIGLIKR
jgi:DNA-binding CsgD family transcriptional regulator